MANWLTQPEHLLEVESNLEDGTLVPLEFSADEKISTPFKFVLEMISGETNITPDQMVGKRITVTLNADKKNRAILTEWFTILRAVKLNMAYDIILLRLYHF